MKTEHESTTRKHTKNIPYMMHEKQRENCKKNEIDESHKSQFKFEYDVHLLNYTIK